MKYLALLLLIACATQTSKYITPYADHFEVNYKAKEKDEVDQKTLTIANDYCGQKGKSLVVDNKEVSFEGDVPEKVYEMVRKAGKTGSVFFGGSLLKVSDKVLADAGYRMKLKGSCK